MTTDKWDPLLHVAPGRLRQVTSYNDDVRGGNWLGLRPAEARPKRILLEPGETHTMLSITGAGVVTRVWLTVIPFPPFSGLHDVVIRCYWDDEPEPSVQCSLGDFFGAPFGRMRSYVSAPLSVTSGGFSCSFPMPFSSRALVQLTNEGNGVVDPLFYQVTYRELDEQPATELRFHAGWNRENPTTAGTPYTILDTTGRGNYVGARLDMQNRQQWIPGSLAKAIFPYGLGFGMLEGPEHIFIDGESEASISGTGTEDYFNAGWYFLTGRFSAPTHGCTMRNWVTGRASAYRFHVDVPVPFTESIRVTMDHGMNSVVETDYSSVAYWYQTEPHPPYPALPSPAERRPTPATGNVAQSLALLAPAAAVGWVGLRRLLRRNAR